MAEHDDTGVYRTKSGRIVTDDEIEHWSRQAEDGHDISHLPRLPTMQTTTDVLPLFLIAMTDLAKVITRMAEKEIESM